MTNTTSAILGTIPALQATALLSHNLGMMKKKKKRSMMHMGMMNLAGIGMIGATAGMIQ